MKFAKKADVILLAVILVLSVGGWFLYRHIMNGKMARAEIYYGSTLVMTVPLKEGAERSFSIPQNEHVIFHLSADGSIAFEESDCPDKVCIRSGRLRLAGESAACLPNQIVLKIVGNENGGADEPDLVAQ